MEPSRYGRVLSRAEDPQALALKHVHNTAAQGIVHADHRQIDLLLLREGRQLFKFHGADVHALRQLADAAVSRGAVDLFRLRALGQLPHNGVLSAAASHYQYFHELFLLFVGNPVNRFRQNLPFRLLHHPALQDLRGIPFLHLHRFLQKNGAGIHSLVHVVDSGSGNLHSPL